MDIREKIIESLEKASKDLKIEPRDIQLEYPKDLSHGDFTTNLVLRLAKDLKANPQDLASKITAKLIEQKLPEVKKVETAGPGFINFWLSEEYLQNQVKEIIKQKDNFGLSSKNKGKKASVEFISANPTGPLHIGNARGGPLGDVIANVLEKTGYQVKREYLHNDVGGQVNKLGEAIYFELNPDKKEEASEVFYQGEYIKDLAKKVGKSLKTNKNLSKEKFTEKMGKIAVEILLEEILNDAKDMGIKFDKIQKESDLRLKADKELKNLGNLIKKKEGAEWFAPNDDFLKDRETVVRKSDGELTYFASDIVYHKEKFESGNDLVVDVLGSNHSGHVPKLQAIVKALGFDTNNFKVILYQYVRLKRGSQIVAMSKRAGNIITAREVLDEVGKDAFRFFLLMSRVETHMDFDLELAKKKASDNPVFYVQYAYSRICSIFKKQDFNAGSIDTRLLRDREELDLIRHLLKLPFLIDEVSNNFTVHSFTTYATELATLFHKFYEAKRVISENKEEMNSRLALLKATQITLKNTLDLLGVSAPERMEKV